MAQSSDLAYLENKVTGTPLLTIYKLLETYFYIFKSKGHKKLLFCYFESNKWPIPIVNKN